MDEELRALERTFRGSGTREAELAWLRARARSGDAAADVDRLSPALRSGSDAKASQALKVLSEAGELPHALLPEVFCITQDTSLKKARKAAKKLFEVHAPQPLQAAVKAHLKRSLFGAGETKVADRLRAIETEGGDGLDFARLAELLCEDHNTGFLYVLRHGAEKDVERAIRGRIEDASLDLVNLELLPRAGGDRGRKQPAQGVPAGTRGSAQAPLARPRRELPSRPPGGLEPVQRPPRAVPGGQPVPRVSRGGPDPLEAGAPRPEHRRFQPGQGGENPARDRAPARTPRAKGR